MKKKIFSGVALLTIAVAMAIHVNFGSKYSDISDISLANVEALANTELSIPGQACQYYCREKAGAMCSISQSFMTLNCFDRELKPQIAK